MPADKGDVGRGCQRPGHYAPPPGNLGNDGTKKLRHFCSGKFPVFVHPSLKLLFSWNIKGFKIDSHRKNDIDQG